MFRIAIVEDDAADQATLRSYVQRYFQEENTGHTCQVDVFDSAVVFLDGYRAIYDIIFLDIQMPYLNGMDAALKLREMDEAVPIVFVTGMARYAVRGYDVNALGFLLKPVSYYDFFLRVRKAVSAALSRRGTDLILSRKQGVLRISTRELYYVEVTGHTLHYHTRSEVISVSGSMADAEEQLRDSEFLRCNNCYLVNPRAIQSVKGYGITLLNGEQILISHPRKKAFMAQLSEWLGAGKSI